MNSKIEITSSWLDDLKEKFDKKINPKYYQFDYNREFVLDPEIIEREVGRPLTDNECFYANNNANKRLVRPKVKISDDLYQKCWENSYILSKNVGLSKNNKWCHRLGNIIAFGAEGTDMKRSFIGSNILQSDRSMVIHDVGGALVEQYGAFLQNQGYKIKCLNLDNMTKSQHFNPFVYIKEENDILTIVSALTAAFPELITPEDRFLTDSRKALLSALIFYLFETGPIEKITFQNIVKLFAEAVVTDKDGSVVAINGLDGKFDELFKINQRSLAVKFYKIFKLAPAKIMMTVAISLSILLTSLVQSADFVKITNNDELELEKLGKEKTALFVITPIVDTTFNILASVLFHTVFNVLYKEGKERQEKLNSYFPAIEVPVQFILSNCENIPKIYHFEERLFTCTRHNISVVMTFHDYGQVEKIYEKNDALSIVGCCDARLMFVGGSIDPATSKVLCPVYSHRHMPLDIDGVHKHMVDKKGVLLPVENILANVGRDAVFVFISGVAPICDNVFKLQNHPNYQYTAEANPVNRFVFK